MRLLLLILIPFNCFAGDVYVSGHYRNGVYIPAHYRSENDQNPYNNYSTQGNINPYTGEEGDEFVPMLLSPPMSHDTTPKSTIYPPFISK